MKHWGNYLKCICVYGSALGFKPVHATHCAGHGMFMFSLDRTGIASD